MSWFAVDYHCVACGKTTDSLEERADVRASIDCECGAVAERCLAAPRIKQPIAWVDRGSSERPSWSLDTRPEE